MYGVEIEVPGLPSSAGKIFRERGCVMHNDGSLRRPVYSIDAHPFIFPSHDDSGHTQDLPEFIRKLRERDDYGAEIVTSPLSYDDMLTFLHFAQTQLRHIPKFSSRGSIHYHVGVEGKPWRYVQNLMGWFLHLEALLYRFASEGGTHRGEETYDGSPNDYRYCRPLSAPICCGFLHSRTGDVVPHPVIDVQALLDAESASEFLAAWGRLDYYNVDRKYIPHRLHGINLLTVLLHGAVEWRLFDGYYRDLIAFFKIVCRIHELAEQRPYPTDTTHVLGTTSITSDYARSLFVDTTSTYALTEKKFSKLWGVRFPEGVKHSMLLHHYSNMTLYSLSEKPLVVRKFMHGSDDGSDSFTLFAKRRS